MEEKLEIANGLFTIMNMTAVSFVSFTLAFTNLKIYKVYRSVQVVSDLVHPLLNPL